MTKVTIIGATGSLGRAATKLLLEETDVSLTLFSRRAASLPDHARVTKIGASVSDSDQLQKAMTDADLVFVALSGNLPQMISDIITAMNAVGTKRIIFIASYGIYGELPGQNGHVNPILSSYRQAADILEQSGLEITILRPGWFDNSSDRSYDLYDKDQVIYGNTISRLAIADFVKEVALDVSQHIGGNYGMVRD